MRKSPSCAPPARGFRPPCATAASPSRRPRHDQDPDIMDIERINAIGNLIADLSERTTALRGYL